MFYNRSQCNSNVTNIITARINCCFITNY